MGLYKLINNTP